MHEGGADAFAYRALYHFNLIDKKIYREIHTNILNSCIFNLDHQPLKNSHKRGRFKNYYNCGAVIALITEFALKQKYPKKDLFDFWNSLFEKAKKENYEYNEDLYFDLILDLTDNDHIVDSIKQFTDKFIKDPAGFFIPLFNTIGISLRKIKFPSGEILKEIAKKTVRAIVKMDCSSKHSITTSKHYFILHGINQCNKITKDIKIDRLEGIDIFKKPLLAHRRAEKICKKKEMLKLGFYKSKKILEIKCEGSLPEVPDVLSIESDLAEF
jgi:hypothetical protein